MPTEPPPAHILAAAAGLWSAAGQGHWVPVEGPSMLPFLQPGDEVWVAPVRDRLRRGDVMLLTTPAGLVVHRLLRAEPWRQPKRLWTQGDNNRQPDPPANAQAVLGQVLTIRRRGRTLALDGARRRASGWLIAVGLLVWDGCVALAQPWGTPGRLAAGAVWRLLRVFRLLVSR